MRSRFVYLAVGFALCASLAQANDWSVSFSGPNNSLMQFNYGNSGNSPQYGVIDLSSAYLRMNYGPPSGWGTSIVVMPSYWSGGAYHQGTPVSEDWHTSAGNLVINLSGTSTTLTTRVTLSFAPPSNHQFRANVSATTSGSVQLDNNRPGEAFKPVFLSSMHDSGAMWDASLAYAGSQTYRFPTGGWIVSPSQSVYATNFGLLGGDSAWKPHAPAVHIDLTGSMQIAGWLNTDNNPNDDNVGFWAATDVVLPYWSYSITVTMQRPFPLPSPHLPF